jgi:UDP-N-acetylmuramate dehydrogenase
VTGTLTTHLDELARLDRALGSLARRDQPLGSLTTYRVGGPAALFCPVTDEEELVLVAKALVGRDVPVLVVGKGSNLLVADKGFPGLAIVLGPGFEEFEVTGPDIAASDIDVSAGHGTEVRAGAALSLPVLARRTVAAGLRGLEWAVGVPGSVGGAVRMNAGGHGSDTSATLVGFRWVDLTTASVHEAGPERLGFGYRHSTLLPTEVVVAARHRLVPGDVGEGRAAIDEIVRWRRANQPGGSNAGSVFTNPPGDSAGRLIDASGLKGLRLGSAQVSPKHANFIQADPDGSADDVKRLIDRVRAEVAAATGVVLRTELCLVGFDEGGTP